MKKVSLFIVATLFSIGVFAQTTPSTVPAATSTNAVNKAPKSATATGTSKNHLKKTNRDKKVTHHVTAAKKSPTPAQPKDASGSDLKK